MARTIFYSWQNDLPAKSHRNFLDQCIRLSLKSLQKEEDVHVYMEYDRDTKGLMGSPDITESIFEKIDKSVMFVCDISIINSDSDNKKTPNPNVLMELGYAVSKLGWERVVCFFDTHTGEIEDLPFDLRQKRITAFDPAAEKEKERVASILATNIKDLYVRGKLFNPLNDYMKGKIDKQFLHVGKQLANIMFGTYSLSDGLAHVTDLLELSYDTIYDRMCNCAFPGFVVLNTFETAEQELNGILKDIFSSSYFPKEWAYCVLELLDWIRSYSHFISQRNPHFPFCFSKSRTFDNLAVISGASINPNNPQNSKIILESIERDGKRYIDPDFGRVINTTDYPGTPGELPLSDCFAVCENSYDTVAKKIYEYVSLCKRWLDITDSEFILDPDTYHIM